MKNRNKLVLPPEVREEIEKAFKKCYACNKCVSGCPVASDMDYPPSSIVKWLALGDVDRLLTSNSIWVCSSCQNCYSRCPFEINIPHIIDLLKEHASKNRVARQERAIRLFHNVFLLNIRNLGRIHETSLIGIWKMISGKWFSDLGLGMKMFIKGKLKIFPEKIKRQGEVKRLFKK